MKIGFVIGALAISGLLSIGCSSSGDEPLGDTSDDLSATGSFVSRGTGYYPSHSGVEGGFKDRQGNPLHTLQQFLAGQASYVSVAMDSRAFPYGQRLRIHELEAKYGRAITFKVVDTGGGQACNNTGDCNPGGNGAGMICVSGQCVEGCTANWQCPGSTTCKSGHCR